MATTPRPPSPPPAALAASVSLRSLSRTAARRSSRWSVARSLVEVTTTNVGTSSAPSQPVTVVAVRVFQLDCGIPADCVIDPAPRPPRLFRLRLEPSQSIRLLLHRPLQVRKESVHEDTASYSVILRMLLILAALPSEAALVL